MEQAPGTSAPMATGSKPNEEVITAFLTNGIKKMRSEETREMLKGHERPGQKLIEVQRSEWDPLGVDRDMGCGYLDKLEEHYPGNTALIMQRNDFIFTAQRTFIQAMEDKKPAQMERKKPMPRATMIEFFDACNTKMDLPETRQRFLQHLESTQQVPNQLIIDLQRDMLEVFGFEREHGCAMLSNIGTDFPKDQELHQRFEMWRKKAHSVCMQVVRQHQMKGGSMPEQPFAPSPEQAELMAKAREAVEAMSPEQRKELMGRFQKKVEVYMGLPPEGKESHMKKLSDGEKLEYAKAQIIMVSAMQMQWRQQQQTAHEHVPPGMPVDSPQQQQMM
uniref:Uncharacterized protein n=1 Tax=Alexandrium catenella TaxID=2925 RepID=A0A7S1RNK7_ALECA|mmetsp:Transcript_65747/g.175139  ORF Transcript_65747/g.175139 Transcript_65747/m.175139 type:complete len:333 (+) Transcript_65747:68-1066(+)